MQILNMNHLYYFSVIADLGSISMATKKLHITQPALSHQLKQLESSLDCKLFDRVGRRLVLNDKGEYLLDFVNNIFRETENMLATIKCNKVDNLKNIVIGVEYGLDYNYIYEFVRPIITRSGISLKISEGDSDMLKDCLKKRNVDLILSFSNLSSSDMEIQSIPIKGIKMALVAPNKLNSTRMSLVQLFESFPLVRYNSINSFDNLLSRYLIQNNIIPSREITLSNFQAVKDLLAQGKGIGILPYDDISTDEQNSNFFIVKNLEDFNLYINATYLLTKVESEINGKGIENLVMRAKESFHSNLVL